jgi:hypothetical protein
VYTTLKERLHTAKLEVADWLLKLYPAAWNSWMLAEGTLHSASTCFCQSWYYGEGALVLDKQAAKRDYMERQLDRAIASGRIYQIVGQV